MGEDLPSTTTEEKKSDQKLNHEHVYSLVTGNEIGWQAIIYDLINTEQLDPWDLNLISLSKKYLEKIRELEEANFLISSNVILAASLLLRIKTELLLEKYIRSLDDILFDRKEEKKPIERIEIDEEELPLIYPKSPLPRLRKVTLKELMSSLDKAIKTENRRIRKEITIKQARREAEIVFPKVRINIKDRIKEVYVKILTKFKQKKQRVSYTDLVGNKKEERIACFLPVLHLNNQHKVFLEQEIHFEEIYVWVYKHYKKQAELLEKKELEILEKAEEVAGKTGFDNPLGDMLDS